MRPFTEVSIVILGTIAFIAIAFLLFPVALWLAWNGVIPHLFHLPTISLLQAFWLDIIFIVFRGIQWNKNK